MTNAVAPSLSRREWGLICALREVPDSLREPLRQFLGELLDALCDPRCPEAQADGVPCPSAKTSCEECRRVLSLLETLRDRVRAA
jgi:hypothetical protein